MNERLILGIDPGIGRLGYAVVSVQGSALRLLVCDVISTSARHAYPQRLCEVYDQLSAIIAQYQPREAAMESLFFGHNVSTAIPVAQARGVAILAVVQQGMTLAEYTPSEVKLAVTGYGAAKKRRWVRWYAVFYTLRPFLDQMMPPMQQLLLSVMPIRFVLNISRVQTKVDNERHSAERERPHS